ncbi:MAG: type II toxin-antitoxin system prevent-host-death family antitoxin [Opitutales bacterium]
MKVKLGHLKTHLSRYLKRVRETGEPIEVCVRDDTVAYLTSAANINEGLGPSHDPETVRRLETEGLRIVQQGKHSNMVPTPGHAADPAQGANSIESIRAEKNW